MGRWLFYITKPIHVMITLRLCWITHDAKHDISSKVNTNNRMLHNHMCNRVLMTDNMHNRIISIFNMQQII